MFVYAGNCSPAHSGHVIYMHVIKCVGGKRNTFSFIISTSDYRNTGV